MPVDTNKKRIVSKKPASRIKVKMKVIVKYLVDAGFKEAQKTKMLVMYGRVEADPDDFNVLIVFKDDAEILRIEVQSPYWVKKEERYEALEAINSFDTEGALGAIFIEDTTDRFTWGYDIMWQLAANLSGQEIAGQVFRAIQMGIGILHAFLDTIVEIQSSESEEVVIPVNLLSKPHDD